MLTELTANRTTREITQAEPHKVAVEVHLLLYRRLKDTATHDAKRTLNGLPTRIALIERAWIEAFSQKGFPNWRTSFSYCCQMLGEDPLEERSNALREIERAWRKALVDWGRRRWQKGLEEIEGMEAEENPHWNMRRAIQEELPIEWQRKAVKDGR